jgi:hypothetical protein
MSKRTHFNPIIFSALFILIILCVACGEKTSTPTITSTQTVTVQETVNTPFEQATATIPLILPTDTGEVGEETFTLPEDPDEIRDLLAISNACQFPCFLGITPGITDYETAVEALSRVATANTGEVKLRNGESGYNFKLQYPESDLDLSFDIHTLDRNKVLELILFPKSSLATFYSVPQVIDFYKEPENIFVFTLSEPYGDGVQPFVLILDYSSKGFLLYYMNPEVKIMGEVIELCYHPEIAPTILLWSPDERRTFLDIAPIGKDESKDAKQLADVALVDSEGLMELLTAPEGFCVQTEKNQWKDIMQYH